MLDPVGAASLIYFQFLGFAFKPFDNKQIIDRLMATNPMTTDSTKAPPKTNYATKCAFYRQTIARLYIDKRDFRCVCGVLIIPAYPLAS